ncbi:hypothetical protein, partial [Paraburkholderia sp. J67]|uniref:hypothetical protein n=1 Tax=Paraburkholderia sp. J67 TaxID=2805435 RepID=UPI002ABE7D28
DFLEVIVVGGHAKGRAGRGSVTGKRRENANDSANGRRAGCKGRAAARVRQGAVRHGGRAMRAIARPSGRRINFRGKDKK